jgi:probable phosphoglycerate mutase
MSTRLFLMRHGQTDWSQADRFTGSSNVPLSRAGREQARALARRLSKMRLSLKDDSLADPEVLQDSEQSPIAAIYSSPLDRSRDTAGIVAEPLGLSVETIPDVKELDYGAWEGLRREEIVRQYPREFETWTKDPALYAPPRGESGLTLVARVRPAIDRLVADHPGETIVMVAHKTVNRLLICSLFNIPLKHYRWVIWQNVACMNVINFVSDDAVSLIKLNDTSHYESFLDDAR